MSDLQNLTPANTYKGLLQVGDYTNGVDSTVKAVLDGEGTASALAIGTTKVGIGTTSPTQELDVNGDIVSTTLTTSGAVTAGSVSTSGAVGAGSIDVGGNVVADEYALDQVGSSSSAVAIHAPATNELAIRTNSAEAMRITSDGNVGIGTTSPDAKLEVNGNIANTTDSNAVYANSNQGLNGALTLRNEVESTGLAGNNVGLVFQNYSTGNSFGRISYIASVQEQDGLRYSNLVFGTDDGTGDRDEKMRITSSGDVGIGTTSPSSKLEIIDSVNHLNLKVPNTISQSVMKFSDSAGLGATINYDHNTDKLHFITDGTATPDNGALNIDSTGNVGIGTVSPSAPLEISSTTGGVIMPRMTTTQMNAISSPTDGEMIYNTTENKFYGRANGAWTALH